MYDPVFRLQLEASDGKHSVRFRLTDICLTALCGLIGIDEPTIITCITGLESLYYELLFLYSTNMRLRYLRTIVILSKDQRYS
jgi:hypothetical protein